MTVPTEPRRTLDAAVVAELNDLLTIDHDAVESYGVAIRALTNVGRRETVMRFRSDNERHVADLTRLIRRGGGVPVDVSGTNGGPLTRAMQEAGGYGGDRAVIAAFKANVAHTSERYTRAATQAGAWPEDVRDCLAAAADDEARHYEWAEDQLESLEVADSPTARVSRAVDAVQSRLSDGAGRIERGAARGLEAARRGASAVRARLPERLPAALTERPSNRALAVGAIAAGVSFAITLALSATQRRRR
jgi:hypothetical protein